jgi:hypothetical protein
VQKESGVNKERIERIGALDIISKSSESDAGFSIGGADESSLTGVDCATAFVTSDIPSTFDGGAVLALTDGGASTARLELDLDVKTLVLAGGKTLDGASFETRGAQEGSTALEVALPLATVTTVVSAIAVGRLRGGGTVRLTVLVVMVPVAVGRAVGFLIVIIRDGVVGNTELLGAVPVVAILGALMVSRGRGRGRGRFAGQAAALAGSLEGEFILGARFVATTTSTTTTVALLDSTGRDTSSQDGYDEQSANASEHYKEGM